MAANNEELISSFVDLQSTGKEKSAFVAQLQEVYDIYAKIKGIKVNLNVDSSLENVITSSRQLKSNLDNLVKTVGDVTNVQSKQTKQTQDTTKAINDQTEAIKKNAQAKQNDSGITVIQPSQSTSTTTETSGVTVVSSEQITSIKELNAQYKLLQQSTKDAIANYGSESQQATAAADAEKTLKDRIDQVNASYKQLIANKKESAAIPFTSNLTEEGFPKEDVGRTTGPAVSDSELANLKEQLEAQRELSAEKQKDIDVEKSQKEVIAEVQGAYDKFTGSLVNNLRQYTENENILKANKQAQSDLEKTIKDQSTATDAQIAKMAELNQEEVALSEANKNLGVVIRNQSKEQITATGSLEQLRAQLGLLQGAYDKLTQSGRDSSFGVELKKNLDDLTGQVNELEQGSGRFQRNVGNYTNSVNILKPALDQIAGKIEQFTSAGEGNSEVLSKLRAEYQTIESILDQQQRGFSSVTQELNSNKRALQSLAAVGLEDSDVFKQLQNDTAGLQRNFNELQQSTKLLASEAPGLAVLGKVAEGIGAAYGVAASAAQLFSDGDEEVEKELTKLVSIMTFLQSIGEINKVLKEKDAILTVIQTNATKAYNGVLALLGLNKKAQVATDTALIETETTLATTTEANVVANTELATSQEAVAVTAVEAAAAEQAEAAATAEIAVSGEAAAVATGELAVANEAVATTATAATTAALPLLGIFAAIGVALGYIVQRIIEYNQQGAKELEIQKGLNEVLKATNDILIDQAALYKGLNDSDITYSNNQLKFAQSAGANQEKQFALRKQINSLDKEQAQQQLNILGTTYAGQAKLVTQLESLDRQKLAINEDLNKAIEEGDKDQQEVLKGTLDFIDQRISAIKPIYEAGKTTLDNLANANAESTNLQIEQAKYEADERRKLLLAETEIEVDLTKQRNSQVLDNDKSYYGDKIEALKSNLDAEKRLIAANLNDVTSNPSSSNADIAIAQKKATQDSYQAQVDYYNTVIDLNKQITTNTAESFSFRYAAAKRFYESSVQLIDTNVKYDLESQKEANDQKLTLYAQYLANVSNLQKEEAAQVILPDEYNKQQLQKNEDLHNKLLRSDSEYYQEKAKLETDQFNNLSYDQQVQIQLAKQREVNDQLLKLVDNAGKDRANVIAKDQAEANIALNDEYNAGTLNAEQYEKAKRDLAIKYGKESVEALIQIAESKLAIEKQVDPNSDKVRDLSAQIAQLKKQLSDLGVAVTNNNFADLSDIFSDIAAVADKLSQALQSIGNISYENQKAQLESLSQQQDAFYQQEHDRIQDSNIATDQKYKQLAILDSQHNAQQDAIAAKQRALDNQKAEFDKESNILNIITGTLAAAAKAGFVTPLGIAIEIAGAAALVEAIATPVPHYRYGTKDHDGGLAYVGDGNKHEIAEYPDGRYFMTPKTETLVELPAHTIVYPDADKFLRDHQAVAMHRSVPYEAIRLHLLTQQGLQIGVLEKRLKSIERTIANKKETHVHATHMGLLAIQKDLNDELIYLTDNFNF